LRPNAKFSCEDVFTGVNISFLSLFCQIFVIKRSFFILIEWFTANMLYLNGNAALHDFLHFTAAGRIT